MTHHLRLNLITHATTVLCHEWLLMLCVGVTQMMSVDSWGITIQVYRHGTLRCHQLRRHTVLYAHCLHLFTVKLALNAFAVWSVSDGR